MTKDLLALQNSNATKDNLEGHVFSFSDLFAAAVLVLFTSLQRFEFSEVCKSHESHSSD